jgi:para-aminobenzoate synthetase component 1
MIATALERIRAGELFQVNLSQRLMRRCCEDPLDVFARLQQQTPSPFSGYFDLGSHQIVSVSPERFLLVRNRHVEARPIKGTRRGMPTPEADLFAKTDLHESGKDLAENTMIVDLLRNDLSRVCTDDSVQVTQLCGLESYRYVHHLVSVVEGDLADRQTAWDVVRAAFPCGSVTGAPKVRAMETIVELEKVARGAYCGSLGYMGLDGGMDLNVLIRTITFSGGWCQMPVGGGIVADSDPEQEYQETWHKSAGMLRAF